MDITNQIFNGNTFEVLKSFPDGCIDCSITSPPYWNLRDYKTNPIIWGGDKNCSHEWTTEHKKPIKLQAGNPEFKRKWREQATSNDATNGTFCIKCGAWNGQLGLEPTPQLFINHLCDIFDEVKRVLKPTGTCWVNIGDTYSTSTKGSGGKSPVQLGNMGSFFKGQKLECDAPKKSLLMIPERFALEMINRGWILRNVIIFLKPNCMPESVKDRFTRDFEYIYFFVKNNKYYFEQQFEPLKEATVKRYQTGWNGNKKRDYARGSHNNLDKYIGNPDAVDESIRRGKNKRTTWPITTTSCKEAHFATFSPKLVETPILAGCPEMVCVTCGQPKQKIFKKEPLPDKYKIYLNGEAGDKKQSGSLIGWRTSVEGQKWLQENPPKHIGWTKCKCKQQEIQPGIVLDPFAGSGTTLMVAKQLGRRFVGIEINPEYIGIIKKRINENK